MYITTAANVYGKHEIKLLIVYVIKRASTAPKCLYILKLSIAKPANHIYSFVVHIK